MKKNFFRHPAQGSRKNNFRVAPWGGGGWVVETSWKKIPFFRWNFYSRRNGIFFQIFPDILQIFFIFFPCFFHIVWRFSFYITLITLFISVSFWLALWELQSTNDPPVTSQRFFMNHISLIEIYNVYLTLILETSL